MTKKTVFSGVQPTGGLQLGNYLGAFRNFAPLQQRYNCIYCVVDLHAITVWHDPQQLRDNVREVAAAFVATGIDTDEHILFVQSQVKEHSQLAWIFNCVVRMGWLNRMTQFKDKGGANFDDVSAGLFVYPTLMAADVLLYHADLVPVGHDQKQHIELMRDIAQKFNNDFAAQIREKGFAADFFKLPEPVGADVRIMSLRDGSKKMIKTIKNTA